jgi:hypothetical protein
MSSLINALLIILFFLALNTAEYYSWSKYHLVHIVLSEGKLKVEYLQKDLSKTVEDQRGKFFFEKKTVWYKGRGGKMKYLLIHHNDEVLLKQYPIADVDEALFDALIERFSCPAILLFSWCQQGINFCLSCQVIDFDRILAIGAAVHFRRSPV